MDYESNAVCPSDDTVPTVASAVQPREAAPLQFRAVHSHADAAQPGRDLVLAYHYSGTFHPAFSLMGLAFKADMCVAACCFRTPAARWKYPVLELARLVRKEGERVSLTWLISRTVAAVRSERKYDLLISYADATHEHHGGVYQASSWNYSGQTKRQNDEIVVDGLFIAGRACNNRFGTRSVTRLRELFPNQTFEAHWDEGKFLYWKALSRRAERTASDLGLKKLTYPKPWFRLS